jgi:NitT/TauT family transport system substrate-binding protein
MNRIRLLGMLAAATAAALVMSPAGAQTDLKFALDWKFEGPSAPYFVAIDKGYYKAEGLNVTIDSGPGSVAGIARIAAGTYPLGFFDINSLVKFRDQNPDKKVQAVLMIYDKPAFAIGTTAKTGITKPKDLEGRVLGAPTADGAFAQWKAFVKENGIDESKVKIENVGFSCARADTAEGKVDAITGFSFSMYYNPLQKGRKPEDIKTMQWRTMVSCSTAMPSWSIRITPRPIRKRWRVLSAAPSRACLIRSRTPIPRSSRYWRETRPRMRRSSSIG